MAPRLDAHARFEALVGQYSRLISSVVRRVTGRSGDLVGEDIEQKVRIALWRQIESEQAIDHPVSYIYKMAVREAVRVVRRESSRETEPLPDSDALRGEPRDDPWQNMVQREQREKIEASLDELLPDRQRAVRSHLAGFAVQEIEAMYGWSYQKARNLVARGMTDLREALKRRGIDG